jgi:hypothetical protein
MAGARSEPVLSAHEGAADTLARPGCDAEYVRHDDLEFTCAIVAICAPSAGGCRAWANAIELRDLCAIRLGVRFRWPVSVSPVSAVAAVRLVAWQFACF